MTGVFGMGEDADSRETISRNDGLRRSIET